MFPLVATLSSLLAIFLVAVAGLLFIELILLVRAYLLRVLIVFTTPWPLPIEVASLNIGSKLTRPLLIFKPNPKLDPTILGVGSKIDR